MQVQKVQKVQKRSEEGADTEGILRVMKNVVGVANQLLKKESFEGISARKAIFQGYMFEVVFFRGGGEISAEEKARIRNEFIHKAFREGIHPYVETLGWKVFRITTCPRQNSLTEYCWRIERRDA